MNEEDQVVNLLLQIQNLQDEICAAWVFMSSMEGEVPKDELPAWHDWYARNKNSMSASIGRSIEAKR